MSRDSFKQAAEADFAHLGNNDALEIDQQLTILDVEISQTSFSKCLFLVDIRGMIASKKTADSCIRK